MTHNHIQQPDPIPTSSVLSTARDHGNQHMVILLPSTNLPWAVPGCKGGTCITEAPVPPYSAQTDTLEVASLLLAQQWWPDLSWTSVVPLSLLSRAGKHRTTRSTSGFQHNLWALNHCSKTVVPCTQQWSSIFSMLPVKHLNSNIFMADSKLCDTTHDGVFKLELVYDWISKCSFECSKTTMWHTWNYSLRYNSLRYFHFQQPWIETTDFGSRTPDTLVTSENSG